MVAAGVGFVIARAARCRFLALSVAQICSLSRLINRRWCSIAPAGSIAARPADLGHLLVVFCLGQQGLYLSFHAVQLSLQSTRGAFAFCKLLERL